MTRKEKIKNLKNLNAQEIKDLTKSYYSDELIFREISCTPMDKEWIDGLKSQLWREKLQEQYKDLVDRLLSIGGEYVCLVGLEEDYENILKRGQLWTGKHSVKFMKGKDSCCHQNSCDIWHNNKDKCVIATGYALSNDGVWRQHSWVIHIKPSSINVVETTVKREAYYGFAMTYDECEKFEEANL